MHPYPADFDDYSKGGGDDDDEGEDEPHPEQEDVVTFMLVDFPGRCTTETERKCLKEGILQVQIHANLLIIIA